MPGRFPAPILALAVVFASGVARASMTYPPTIAAQLPATPTMQYLGIKCTFAATSTNQPPCTICHRDLQGGVGTVIRKFGQDLQFYYGLTSQNPTLLVSALNQANAMNLDSDGDGDTDIEALKECRDPNLPASANIPPLQYGCGSITGRPRQTKNAAGSLLLGTLAILTVVRRRRRRADR